jgi:hypothetical protein
MHEVKLIIDGVEITLEKSSSKNFSKFTAGSGERGPIIATIYIAKDWKKAEAAVGPLAAAAAAP